MKKLELEQMEKIEGGRFWGSEYYYDVEFDSACASGMSEIGYRDYYVFGVRTGHTEVGSNCIDIEN